MTYTKIFLCCLCCLMLCVLGIAGCTSNTSTSSGYGEGGGYSINLTTTNSLLPQTGKATLIATVRDAQNNPVNDSTRGVTFSSSQGGTFSTNNSINLGDCTVIYTPPSATTLPAVVTDQITASYQGAFAYVSIEVYKQ